MPPIPPIIGGKNGTPPLFCPSPGVPPGVPVSAEPGSPPVPSSPLVLARRPPVLAPRPPVLAPRPPVLAPRPPVLAPRPLVLAPAALGSAPGTPANGDPGGTFSAGMCSPDEERAWSTGPPPAAPGRPPSRPFGTGWLAKFGPFDSGWLVKLGPFGSGWFVEFGPFGSGGEMKGDTFGNREFPVFARPPGGGVFGRSGPPGGGVLVFGSPPGGGVFPESFSGGGGVLVSGGGLLPFLSSWGSTVGST